MNVQRIESESKAAPDAQVSAQVVVRLPHVGWGHLARVLCTAYSGQERVCARTRSLPPSRVCARTWTARSPDPRRQGAFRCIRLVWSRCAAFEPGTDQRLRLGVVGMGGPAIGL